MDVHTIPHTMGFATGIKWYQMASNGTVGRTLRPSILKLLQRRLPFGCSIGWTFGIDAMSQDGWTAVAAVCTRGPKGCMLGDSTQWLILAIAGEML